MYTKSDEFLNWLDGYLSAIDDVATSRQFETIKQKLQKTLTERDTPIPSPYTITSEDIKYRDNTHIHGI
jgi:hypothetical protein